MIVVNKADPAKTVANLTDYTIIFGPSEAEEKHSAAIQLLEKAGVHIPIDRQKIDDACSDGACKVIDLGPTSKTAAVISSYAQPLLEGLWNHQKRRPAGSWDNHPCAFRHGIHFRLSRMPRCKSKSRRRWQMRR